MVSSELVVLLIVCVGINTGSAQQEYCQGGPSAERTCRYNGAFDINTDCVNITLQCVGNLCSANINSFQRNCIFNTVNVTAQCCFCNNSNTNETWWYCGDTISSVSPSNVVSMPKFTTVTMATTTVTIKSTMLTATKVPDALNITAVIVPVVVVLVVCLLVVCAIATIIILYQRAKHKSPRKQERTDDCYTTLHQLDNTLYTTSAPQDDGQYNHTHHGHTASPPIYSTLAEGGAPADYSTIVDKEAPVSEYSEIQQPASDTSNEGLVYSAVVVKDDKKTTVKTTAQNGVFDDSQQQPAPDTSNEGLVYSAVVVKDGKKTTIKTTAQTSSTSDTVQPAEGMVYSAVIRQDGKKTSVKVTVE